MSGPKYGQIILGAIRRQKLMKELDAALGERERKALVNKQTALQLEIDSFMEKHPISFAEKISSSGEDKVPNSATLQKLNAQIGEYKKLAAQKCSTEGDSKTLAKARTDSLERFFRMGNLADIIRHTSKRLEAEIENRSKITHSSAQDKLYSNEDISLCTSTLDALYDKVLEELSISCNFIEAKAAVDEIVNAADCDNATKEEMLRLRLNGAKIEKTATDNKPEYEALVTTLESLCELLGKGKVSIPENIHALRDMVNELSEEAYQRTMGEYISDSLQNVMERLGYDIIGGDVVSTTKHTTQKDYYEFSETSIINVSANEEGAVLFEVMGKSDGEMTSGEKLAVKDDMDKFCPDYQRVKDLLTEYDLTITDERTCEADVRYVRAVSGDFIADTKRRGKKKARRMMSDE